MKVPRKYMNIKMISSKDKTLRFNIRIKRWCWPVLIFNALKERGAPLLAWLMYPYFVARAYWRIYARPAD